MGRLAMLALLSTLGCGVSGGSFDGRQVYCPALPPRAREAAAPGTSRRWRRSMLVVITSDHGRAANFRDHGRAPESQPVWLVAAGGPIVARGVVAGAPIAELVGPAAGGNPATPSERSDRAA